MLKNSTYKEKFALLSPWMPSILDPIKKEIKNEHLRKDLAFFNQNFAGKQLNKITLEEMAHAYAQAVCHGENGEELGEFLSNRWLLKHSDIYHHFEQEFNQIQNNFDELESLDKEVSLQMMEKAVKEFGAPKTFLFCVLNSVVFPDEVFKILGEKAQRETSEKEAALKTDQEQRSLEEMEQNHKLQLARLTDKYEKKLLGLQKKYVQDVNTLKKQLAALQRKLSGHE